MALPGGVVDQKNIAGTKLRLVPSSTSISLSPDRLITYCRLGARCQVVDRVGRNMAEDDALPRLEFLDLHLDLVEVRLAVRSAYTRVIFIIRFL